MHFCFVACLFDQELERNRIAWNEERTRDVATRGQLALLLNSLAEQWLSLAAEVILGYQPRRHRPLSKGQPLSEEIAQVPVLPLSLPSSSGTDLSVCHL